MRGATLENKRSWPKILIGVVVLLVAIAAYSKFSSKEEPVTYETTKVTRRTVKAYVSAIGTIESTTTVTVGTQVSGPLSEVLVDFNSPVKEGQVLARIDPTELLAAQARAQATFESALAGLTSAQADLSAQNAGVRQAEVAIASAQASLSQVRGTVEAAKAGVANSQASLESRKAEMANNLVQYKRSEDLVNRELIALSDRDQARTTYLVSAAGVQTAEAAVSQSKAQLVQAEAQLAGAQNEIRAARARVASARAQVEGANARVTAASASVQQAQAGVTQASVKVQQTTITSPISGVVIDRKVDEGQTVQASFNTPELFTIARDLSKMQVKAEVSEADIGRITEGALVKFTVDAYPGREFEGAVQQVRSAPDTEDKATSNVVVYGVMVTADNTDLLLKPGMTATVEILAEKLEKAMVIPSQALRYVPPKDDEKKKKGKPSSSPTPEVDKTKKKEEKLEPGTRKGIVWVKTSAKPEKREIVTSISVDDDVVVVSGDLKVDDEVITEQKGGKSKRGRFRLSF